MSINAFRGPMTHLKMPYKIVKSLNKFSSNSHFKQFPVGINNLNRWAAQIAHQGQLAHHVGKRQAAVPVTPGNIPGLVPGSAAAAQW